MLDKLQSADLQPYLNQTFTIRLPGIEPIGLELVSVTELGEARPAASRRPFSITFLGPVSDQYLLQSIYRLEHEQMGVLDLFIVPLGPQNGRMRYEAILT